MPDITAAFQEYLELYSYFGRGGLPKLSRDEFTEYAAEFEQLVAAPRPLADEKISRVAQLKSLLLRDRPHLSELNQPKVGRR